MYHTVLHTDNKYAAPSRSGQLEQAIPSGEVGHRAHLVPEKARSTDPRSGPEPDDAPIGPGVLASALAPNGFMDRGSY